MSSTTRPLAGHTQRAIIGTATLVDMPLTTVELVAKALDTITGRNFYVVRSNATAQCFGVWPEELCGIAYCQPVNY